jgi:regulator of RNase E activity RraA
MNRAIKIGDVTINNGDYIYADDDGVLAIPKDLWPSILEQAMINLKKEFNIRYAVIMGEDIDKVLGTHGTF